MRAHELVSEGKTTFRGITLLQLNKEKCDYMRRKESLERRQRLIPLMYANPGKAHERLEFEKVRLELKKQKAELAATKAEAQAETSKAISDHLGQTSKPARQYCVPNEASPYDKFL